MMMATNVQIPGFYTTEQAAERLNLRPDTMRSYVARQLIKPAKRLGNYLLFAQAEIHRYERERRTRGNPAFSKQK